MKVNIKKCNKGVFFLSRNMDMFNKTKVNLAQIKFTICFLFTMILIFQNIWRYLLLGFDWLLANKNGAFIFPSGIISKFTKYKTNSISWLSLKNTQNYMFYSFVRFQYFITIYDKFLCQNIMHCQKKKKNF